MKRGYLKPAYKKFKYKIFKTDEGFYIVDCDYTFWWFVFPFLSWFYAVPAYKISEEQAIALTKKTKILSLGTALALGGIGGIVSILIRPYTRWINSLTLNMGMTVNIIFIIIILILSLLLRVIYSKRAKIDIISKSEEEKRFKIRPLQKFRLISILFTATVMPFITFLAFWMSLEILNPIIILISSGFFYLITWMNCITVGMESVKLKEKKKKYASAN